MAEYTTLEQVKIRLKQFHIDTVDNGDETTSDVVVFDNKEDNPLLEQLILQAENDVKNARKYPSDYTSEYIQSDMENYSNVIVDLTVYDRNKLGGDFQQSDSENGKSRTWVDRTSILASVMPIARII